MTTAKSASSSFVINLSRAERDKDAREQAARDQAARDQAARDQAARDQVARDQAARDQAVRDQAARDQLNQQNDQNNGQFLTAKSCSALSTIKSVSRNNKSAKLSITNNGSSKLIVYWVNYQGKNTNYDDSNGPQLYVAPGETEDINAYQGFVFSVTDDNQNCLGIAETNESRNRYAFGRKSGIPPVDQSTSAPPVNAASAREIIEADINECGNNNDAKQRMAGCSRVIANPLATPDDRDTAYYNRGYVRCHVEPNNKVEAMSDVYTAMQQSRSSTKRYQEFFARLNFYSSPIDGNQRTENYEAVKKYITSGC
jgi:hypothetical protein